MLIDLRHFPQQFCFYGQCMHFQEGLTADLRKSILSSIIDARKRFFKFQLFLSGLIVHPIIAVYDKVRLCRMEKTHQPGKSCAIHPVISVYHFKIRSAGFLDSPVNGRPMSAVFFTDHPEDLRVFLYIALCDLNGPVRRTVVNDQYFDLRQRLGLYKGT